VEALSDRVGVGERWKAGFIANPAYDWAFFIGAPLLGLALSFLLTPPMRAGERVAAFDIRLLYAAGLMTYAHLCVVVFRSHLNPTIFSQHRFRFVVVPLLLFLGLVVSKWIFVIGLVVQVYWDVYHTSAQNFGFCRIYDSRQGNQAEKGRALDFWLNHFIYIGPILGGLSLMSHVGKLNRFRLVDLDLRPFIQAVREWRPFIAQAVVIVGLAYLAFYLFAYWRMSRNGYRVSPQKICLLVSTAAASIWAWGFLHPTRAYFVANFFHALQYFGIVWWMERKSIRRTFRLEQVRHGMALALAGFVGVGALMGLGYYAAAGHVNLQWAISITIVISLMHFWYDGFIWSVRRREVS
jgi:hypothetical protein